MRIDTCKILAVKSVRIFNSICKVIESTYWDHFELTEEKLWDLLLEKAYYPIKDFDQD